MLLRMCCSCRTVLRETLVSNLVCPYFNPLNLAVLKIVYNFYKRTILTIINYLYVVQYPNQNDDIEDGRMMQQSERYRDILVWMLKTNGWYRIEALFSLLADKRGNPTIWSFPESRECLILSMISVQLIKQDRNIETLRDILYVGFFEFLKWEIRDFKKR